MTKLRAPIREEMFAVQGILSKTWVKFFVDVEDGIADLDDKDLDDYIAGTADKITVTSDGADGVILTIPDTFLPGNIAGTATRIGVTDDGTGGVVINILDTFLPAHVLQTLKQVLVADNADGTVTLSLPQDIDTGASPEFDGVQVASAAVAGNYTLTIDDSILLANPGAGEYSTVISPAVGGDDGWGDFGFSNTFFAGATTASFGRSGGGQRSRFFVRASSFVGDSLPQGAIITKAVVSGYVASGFPTANNILLSNACEDADTAVAPASWAQLDALSLTAANTETVLASVVSSWNEFDITTGVQEVVNRVGYTAGNAIMAVVGDNGTTAGSTKDIRTIEYSSGSLKPTITVEFNASDQTITIPTAIITGNPGRPFVVQNISSSGNTVGITCEGAETINGDATVTLSNQYDAVILIPDGTNVKALFFDHNLADWITGTVNQITVTDDGDRSLTLSLPQDIDTGASPEFDGVQVALEEKTIDYTLTIDDSIVIVNAPAAVTASIASVNDGGHWKIEDGSYPTIDAVYSAGTYNYLYWGRRTFEADLTTKVPAMLFRFAAALPATATITSAIITIVQSYTTGGTVYGNIRVEDAAAGTMAVSAVDANSRVWCATKPAWSISGGGTYTSVDISAPINELIASQGAVSDIFITIMTDNTLNALNTNMRFTSFAAPNSAKLDISYTL